MSRSSSAGTREMLASATYGHSLERLTFDGLQLLSLRLPDLLWLKRCSFVGADLRHATLEGARLILCDLRDADLRGASLRGTAFSGCDLRGADLRGADLRHLRFGSVNTGNADGRTLVTGVRSDRGVDLTTYFEDHQG
ncbi:hypothetical protein Kisp01_37110 [Kineosporia sp. NBRC 101677]|uniref:pentapeptide repeat-containing protein n=1 Tax=Kineosporia sp. NBRC 101677 TaxID=3032197 RepID=UPI0024A5C4CB|nr:pentapeptide repeat-containing protein [Kineosporia sp. NBRC 101677]GLY16696.1 hypothetical protein Kisp01_37110 [Kineosporia sp. NBRC 101677]